MNQYWRLGMALGCGVLGLGCGAAPFEPDVDEAEVAEVSAALDATCSVTVDYTQGYVTPTDGGSLYAAASGECADHERVEFLFSGKDPKNRALAAQEFLPYGSGSWQLPPGSLEGTYTLTVEMRRMGGTEIVAKATTKQAAGRVCTGGWVSLTPSTAQPGDPVVVEPDFQCPEGIVPQWKATITKPGGGSMTLPWTTNPTAIWDTAGLLPGPATVQIAVRNLGNTVTDATFKKPYTLGDTCSVATLTASGSGLSRQLDATASCTGAGVPSYAYSVVAPDGTTSVLRDFSSDPSFTWDTTGLDGTFTVRVDVLAQQSPTQPLTSKTLKLAVGDACTKVTLADTWGTRQRSAPLSLVASAACGSAELSFQLRSAKESTWTTVCPYSAQNTCVVDLSAQPAGDYVARALVRKAGSIATSDAASAARDFVLLDGSALIRGISALNGSTTNLDAVSPDGRWLTGRGPGIGLFRWSRTNGYIEPPAPVTNFINATAEAISNAGLVVGSLADQFHTNQPTLWNGSTITQLVPSTSSSTSALGISADGKVVVGDGANGGLSAFRWTAKTCAVDIGAGFRYSGARDVSADGSVVVGYGYPVDGSTAFPTRWTASTGMVALPLLPGCTAGDARSVSHDGKVVVGGCSVPGGQIAYRWSAEGGLENLGPLPGGASAVSAFSTNGDGSVVVGNVVLDNQAVAVIWTTGSGFRFLSDVLAETGTNLSGWTLSGTTDVSSDGKTIVGYTGGNSGFLVTL